MVGNHAPARPLHVHVTTGRLAAGMMGGIVGGLLFGILLLTDFVASPAALDGRAIAPLAAELLGTSSVLALWAAHAATSVILALAFSALVRPTTYRASIVLGIAWGQLAWLGGSLVALRALAGEPIAYDAAAAFAQLGHLLYGIGLGAVYVAFHHQEVRDARASASAWWRAWGAREEEEETGHKA